MMQRFKDITKGGEIRKRLRNLVLFAVVATFSVFSLPVNQVLAVDYNAQIQAIKNQITQYEAQAEALHQQANSLQNALDMLTAEKNALQAEIDLNTAKVAQLNIDIAANEEKMERQKRVISKTITQIYVNNGTSPIEILASSKSVGEFVSQQEVRSSVRNQIKSAMDEIRRIREELVAQRKSVENLIAQQQGQRETLAAKEAEQAELVAKTRGEEAAYQAMVGDLENQQAKIEAALAASLARATYKSVSSEGFVQAGDVVGGVGNTGYSTGPHLHLEMRLSSGQRVDPAGYMQHRPVDMPPAWISQHFGAASSMYGSGYHSGTDYAAATGTPIYAIRSGELRRACSSQLFGFSDYGYVAIVSHGDGTSSIYAHMNGPC